MDRAERYLLVPTDYGRELGGLGWSANGDAIESDAGTFLLSDHLALVLEGVFSTPPVPPFAFVLNVLYLLRHGARDGGPAELDRLREAYRQPPRPGLSRNVGVLISQLCWP